MKTILTVVESNRTVACFEKKMFPILPQIYLKDFVTFLFAFSIFRWYFPYLADTVLLSIFKELTIKIYFLDINLK